jgi:DNA-binding LytR/AlgR family response regulator
MADQIACVILDLTMPRMSGEEAFVELRRINPDARIAVSTGYSEQEASGRFGGERPPAYIQKPYRLAELSQILRGLLDPAERARDHDFR